MDKCGNRPCHDYSEDALKFFMNMSRIVLYNKSESASNISSQAEQIKFCQDENIIMNCSSMSISLHPGEQFNVAVVALGQTSFPVPTIIFNNRYETDQYRLSPSSRPITVPVVIYPFNYIRLLITLLHNSSYIRRIHVRVYLMV